MAHAAYTSAVLLIDAGYDLDVAIECATQDYDLDEYQSDDLAIRIRRFFS